MKLNIKFYNFGPPLMNINIDDDFRMELLELCKEQSTDIDSKIIRRLDSEYELSYENKSKVEKKSPSVI